MTTDENTRRSGEDRRKSDRRSSSSQRGAKSLGSSCWIVLSFALTAVIVGWAFSLPFRKHERPLLIWDDNDVPRGGELRKVRMTKEEADAYRAAAIRRDREFLRRRRDQLRNRGPLRDAADAEAHREERVASMKKKVDQLSDAPEDSLQAKYRQELIDKLSAPE